MEVSPGNIVFDMDEVLFNISPYVYKKMRLHWDEFFMYLKNLGPMTDEEILEREEFEFIDYMMKPEIKEVDQDGTIKALIKKVRDKLCFTSDIYDNLEPTQLCRQTLLNNKFMENPAVKSCTILTRYPEANPGMKEAKEKIFKKYFGHRKIKPVLMTMKESKSEILKESGLNWNVFIDDEIRNIRDIAENFDLTRREFMIPKFGYNKMPADLRLLIMEKGGTFTYYKNIY